MKFGHFALAFLLLCALPARAENAVAPDDIESRMAGTNPSGRADTPVPPPPVQHQVLQQTQDIPMFQAPVQTPGNLYIETVPRPNLPLAWASLRLHPQVASDIPLMRADQVGRQTAPQQQPQPQPVVLQRAETIAAPPSASAPVPVYYPPARGKLYVPASAPAAEPAPKPVTAAQHPGDEWMAPGAEDHVPLPEPIPPAHTANQRPMISIVIDDMGVDRKKSARALMLPPPVAMSYLPYAPDIADQVAAAKKERHELLVHMPMQPDRSTADPGPGYLGTDMSPLALHDRVEKNLSAFTGYIGVNNHMGSKFTCDREGLNMVMSVLAERKLMFLDSRTSPDSVAEDAARKHHLLTTHRDVFIDNDESPASVQKEIAHIEAIAKHYGTAIAIGHPKHVTLTALELWLPTLKDKGFDLVPLSKIIEIRSAGRADVVTAEAKTAATLAPASGLTPLERGAIEVKAVVPVPPKMDPAPPAKAETPKQALHISD